MPKTEQSKRRRLLGNCWMGAALALLLAGGCRDNSPTAAGANAKAAEDAPIAVTSSYLEAAVRDILRGDAAVMTLAGPSMCPGHFDMRPSQIGDLAKYRLLVRFDFQQAMDGKIGAKTDSPLPTLAVPAPGGMCVPESYLAVCRQLADHFTADGQLLPSEAEKRMGEIAGRMAELERSAAKRIAAAGLRDASVLSSAHQEAFCRWLGLRVAAVFSGADTAGVRQIDRAVTEGEAAGVQIVIANEPEGRRLADALADRLHAKVVVFANFPDPRTKPPFDALIESNLAVLLNALPTAEQP